MSLTTAEKTMSNKPHIVDTTAETPTPAPATPTDPFDLANLRIAPNFTEAAGVRKLLKMVPVRKPHRQEYIRVHANSTFRGDFAQIELKEDRESYLVAGADMMAALVDEITHVTLFTAINRQSVTFLWPIPLPKPEGREIVWHTSAREAAKEATDQWVKVSANMSLGAYDITVAEGIRNEPNWPAANFQELIRLAYRDRLITSLDHPVVKRLSGLV
jgi:hypothetical protein